MNKLISIGEVLIDFIPQQSGVKLQDVTTFKRVAGGAPANVAACVSRLGGNSLVLSKLGCDAFGDYLVDTLRQVGVDTSHIVRTSKANTGLAFVSLDETGNRDFSFYRNPSADMLLEPSELKEEIFNSGDILHFCSVDLVDAPVRAAHHKALEFAIKHNLIISFDPNVRLPLWDNPLELKSIINEFIPYAHIVKVSDEELEFITGYNNINDALSSLFVGNVEVVLYTMGSQGSEIYTKTSSFSHKGYVVDVKDTTGSGDSFIGAFLFRLLESKITVDNLQDETLLPFITFANAVGALVATKQGSIPSMPTLPQATQFMKDNN